VQIYVHKPCAMAKLSENSLTENVICGIIIAVHEICNRFIEIMFYRPMMGIVAPVMVR